MKRTVCWFSAGAASAVATHLALKEATGPVEVVYIHLKEEHPDNARFVQDCARWYGVPITIIQNEEYHGSTREVYRRRRFLVGPKGAACTRILKKEVRKAFERVDDRQVFGFTFEEQDRYDEFLDANNIDCDAPLIRYGLRKADCLAIVQAAGIELPMMYRLGYKNNNCIGCVKGGAGYWNKIRRDFPETFEEMAQVEEALGRTICKTTIAGVRTRVTLRQLPPDAGRYEDEPDISCGAACQMVVGQFDAEDDLATPSPALPNAHDRPC